MKEAKKTDVPRAYNYADIINHKFKVLDFNGDWLNHIGKPERAGSWVVFGYSGNGKTSYELQLAKYLCNFEKVHINTLEEGMKLSFKKALLRNNMKAVKSKFTFHSENFDQLVKRLSRKRQPKIVLIDSLQYFFRRKKIDDYFWLLNNFPDTLFIFIAHATKSGQIKTNLAEDILFHSDLKIFVKDFMATIQTSRYGGSAPYLIYKKGYEDRQLLLLKKG